MHAQQPSHSSHRLRGAIHAVNLFPGYAKNAYPGLMYLHASGVASPKACTELSPGWSVLCDTRGLESSEKSHPGRGAWTILSRKSSSLASLFHADLYPSSPSRLR